MAKLLTKRRKRQLITTLLSVAVIGAVWAGEHYGWITPEVKETTNTVQQIPEGQYPVVSFVDGDTITVSVNGVDESIRLIGVDTPETRDPRTDVQCFGKLASDFTKRLIGDQPVRLANDSLNADRDRYNRLLRYVYLPDERLVNAEIIKQGYGFAYTLYPFEKLEEFRDYEKQAREQNLGLWNSCQIQQDGDKKTTHPT